MGNSKFLKDLAFLQAFEDLNLKTQYIKIILLSFDEKPIKEIQGVVQNGGGIQVNGASALRRTCSFNMFADYSTNDLTNIDNLISLNKKIKVMIGYKNILPDFQHYGDIIWFKGGTYVITQASISNSLTGSNISIQGKDKMVKLNGVVGGTIPATIVLHERQEVLQDGTIVISYPTLYQIIQEVVSEYGEESLSNIFIQDLDQAAKALVKYVGAKEFYLRKDNLYFTEEVPEDLSDFTLYSYGQDIGYQPTDFTYPGKLEMPAGSTVTQVLDKIIAILGNFEYFYDLDGHFIFQEKKNYLNSSYTPVTSFGEHEYIRYFSDSKYFYTFKNMAQVSAISNNPKYENIKNDFVVWGKRTNASGSSFPVRYHLAIDTKPIVDLASKYMWEERMVKEVKVQEKNEKGEVISEKAHLELGELLRYVYSNDEKAYSEFKTENSKKGEKGYVLIAKPTSEWREELYRQALERQKDGLSQDYDMELLSEWRKLYDPMNESWYNAEAKSAWNPLVYTSPGSLDYWLDFLDGNDQLRKYGVKAIGRRNKTVNKDTITSLFNPEIQDIIYLENNFSNDEERSKHLKELAQQGQGYIMYPPEQSSIFSISSTGTSAYEEIRELIYQHLTYNSQVSITCLSKPYLEPNNIIYITNNNNGIYGSYVINSFNIPLSHEGSMTIQASEALERI